jgi:hypothetical protein
MNTERKINAPVLTQRVIQHLKGKYIKRQLTTLEGYGILTPQVRKLILDTLNDFARDIQTELGYPE